MFSNPIGQMFSKPEGEEKKKKRNKKSKKLSPEMSEESNPSIHNSKTDLNTAVAEEVPAGGEEAPKCSGLMDIVNEINAETLVEENVEEVETKYEELPVEESTMKTILESMQNKTEQEMNEKAPVVESCWESMLASPPPEETAWESEVAADPQSVDSVWETMLSPPEPEAAPAPAQCEESAWEAMLNSPEPEVDSVKEQCLSQFNISEVTYALVKEFFEEQKDDQVLLKNDLLRFLLKNTLNQRTELKGVSEEDIERALKTIDSNQDDKINFDEFIQLLSLFFSSKNNLKQRITGVLNNQANGHQNPGSLTSAEASSFTNFLHTFFGKASGHHESFLSKLIKKVLKKKQKKSEDSEDQEIDYTTFTGEAAEELEDLCFVKFEQE